MRNITLLSDDDKVVRTQITLTENLKKLIEERTILKNESLSGYLRRAALLLLFLEEKEKQDLEDLANIVIGSVDTKKNPHWSSVSKVRKWVKDLRSEWK